MFRRIQLLPVSVLFILVILVSACSPTVPTTATAEPSSNLPPEAVLTAQAWLATQLNLPLDQIRITEMKQVEWQDSCLGLGQADESCLQAITPGWQIMFEVNGQTHEVRTNDTATVIRSPNLPNMSG